MSFARQLRRKEQLAEIKRSYCHKCGGKLYVKKGTVVCKACGVPWGKVSDRK